MSKNRAPNLDPDLNLNNDIWNLYSSAQKILPDSDRILNLSWRLHHRTSFQHINRIMQHSNSALDFSASPFAGTTAATNNETDDTDNQQFFLSDMNLNGASVFENVFDDDDDDDDDVETHSIAHSDLLNDMDGGAHRPAHNASAFPNFLDTSSSSSFDDHFIFTNNLPFLNNNSINNNHNHNHNSNQNQNNTGNNNNNNNNNSNLINNTVASTVANSPLLRRNPSPSIVKPGSRRNSSIRKKKPALKKIKSTTSLQSSATPPSSSSNATASSSSNPDIKCSNCTTSTTPLWRKDPKGLPLCNACGLFLKLHGVTRPMSLKTDIIKKRQRSSAKINTAAANTTPPPSASSTAQGAAASKKKNYTASVAASKRKNSLNIITPLRPQDIPIPKTSSPSIPQHLRSNNHHLSSSAPVEIDTPFSSFQPDMNMNMTMNNLNLHNTSTSALNSEAFWKPLDSTMDHHVPDTAPGSNANTTPNGNLSLDWLNLNL